MGGSWFRVWLGLSWLCAQVFDLGCQGAGPNLPWQWYKGCLHRQEYLALSRRNLCAATQWCLSGVCWHLCGCAWGAVSCWADRMHAARECGLTPVLCCRSGLSVSDLQHNNLQVTMQPRLAHMCGVCGPQCLSLLLSRLRHRPTARYVAFMVKVGCRHTCAV